VPHEEALESVEVELPVIQPTRIFFTNREIFDQEVEQFVLDALPASVRARWDAALKATAKLGRAGPSPDLLYERQRSTHCTGPRPGGGPCDQGPSYEDLVKTQAAAEKALNAALDAVVGARGAPPAARLASWLHRSSGWTKSLPPFMRFEFGVSRDPEVRSRARHQLDLAAAQDPTTPAGWIARLWRADALLSEGKVAEARAGLDALSSAPTGHAHWMGCVGVRYEESFGALSDAERAYTAALKSDDWRGKSSAALYLVGSIYEQGRYGDVLDTARTILEDLAPYHGYVPTYVDLVAAAAADRLGGVSAPPLERYSPGAFAIVGEMAANRAADLFRIDFAEEAARATIAKAPSSTSADHAASLLARMKALRARALPSEGPTKERKEEARQRLAGLLYRCLPPKALVRDIPADGVKLDIQVRVFRTSPPSVEMTVIPEGAAATEVACIRDMSAAFFVAASDGVHSTLSLRP
jgi:hypothetical protein